jgi:hypothetical protein
MGVKHSFSSKGKNMIEGVWEQGTENIWIWEGDGKNFTLRCFMIYILHQVL